MKNKTLTDKLIKITKRISDKAERENDIKSILCENNYYQN
jgi:hypothetical protein